MNEIIVELMGSTFPPEIKDFFIKFSKGAQRKANAFQDGLCLIYKDEDNTLVGNFKHIPLHEFRALDNRVRFPGKHTKKSVVIEGVIYPKTITIGKSSAGIILKGNFKIEAQYPEALSLYFLVAMLEIKKAKKNPKLQSELWHSIVEETRKYARKIIPGNPWVENMEKYFI